MDLEGRIQKSISTTICVLIANICLGAFSEINMNRNTIVIGLALMIIIFFSHCYLKNKVSKIVRVSFEIMVSMYGFFFLFLISYLKSFLIYYWEYLEAILKIL